MGSSDTSSIGRGLGRTGLISVALVVCLVGLSACSTIDKIKTAVHDAKGNASIIDSFNAKLKNPATTFAATYVTTGSTPATVVYAVQAPKDLAFIDTPTGGSGDTTPVHLVSNSSGEYSCSQPSVTGSGSSTQWTCQKLGSADASAQNEIVSFYTPAHWTSFLEGLSIAAGLAGDKVSTSTMSVNGFNLSCVDLDTPGQAGTSTICSTDQGILGYVKVADDSTSFELKSFTTSPAASLFQLPPGAKVTTDQSGTS